ncbi:MAG TPA: CpsB/CapC family capsule biosynthesis tyrosine phosphatase [Tepidisphaeraceae bacterium]|jgi:protein-tyrosine phosphatase
MIQRIDVHSHLLPNVDDGCRSVEESIACAKRMVGAGYTHSFCTPHIWPTLDNAFGRTQNRVAELQKALDEAGVPLILMPGGEMHIRADFCGLSAEDLVTYNNAGRYALFDFWTHSLPDYFGPCIRHLQKSGIQPILAHPERIEAIQSDPGVVDDFPRIGLWMQCNLECLGEDRPTIRRRLAEKWLQEDRYFLLGSDLHQLAGVDVRLRGLDRAIQLVGEEKVWELTSSNPQKLMQPASSMQ